MAQKETGPGEKPPFTGIGPMTEAHPTIGSPTSADAVRAADAQLKPMLANFRSYLDNMSASMPDAASVRSSVEGMLPESMRGKGFGHEIAYIEDLALIVDRYRKEGNTEAAARAETELKNAIEGFSGMVRGVAVLEAAGASPDTVSMFRNNFLNFVIGTSPEESEAYLSLGRKGASMVDFVADHMPAFKSDPAAWGRMESEIFRFSSNPAGDPATVAARIGEHDTFMSGMTQTVTNIEAAMAGGLSAQLAMFQNMIANLAQKATEEDVGGRLDALKKEIESLEKKKDEAKDEQEKSEMQEKVDYLKKIEKALEAAPKEDAAELQLVAARCLAALSLAHDLAEMETLVSKGGVPPEEAAARVLGVKKEEVKAFAENLRKMGELMKKEKLTAAEAAMRVLGIKDAKDLRVKALVSGFNLLSRFREAGASPAEREKFIESLREGARLQLFILERFPAAGKLKKTLSALSKELHSGKTTAAKAIDSLAKSYSALLDGFVASIVDKGLKSKASEVAKMFLKPIKSMADLEKFSAVVGLVGSVASEESTLKGKAKGAKDGALRMFGRALDIVLRGGPFDAAKTQFDLGKMYASCEDYELAGSIERMSADIDDANAVWAMDYLIGNGAGPVEAAMRVLSAKDKDDPRVKKLLSLFAKSGSTAAERSEYVKKAMSSLKPQYLPLPKKALAKKPAAKAKATPKTLPKEKSAPPKETKEPKTAEISAIETKSLTLSKEEKESLAETAKAVLAMPEAAGDKEVIEQGLEALASGKGTPEERSAVEKMMAVLGSRLGAALKKELVVKALGAKAKASGEDAAASLEKPTPGVLAKANIVLQMLYARKKILSGAKEPALGEAGAILDSGISYFSKTGDPSLMIACEELATRYLSGPDQKMKEILDQAFRQIDAGDAGNGMIFLDLARMYATADKDDKEAILGLARGAAANAKLPGLAVFDDPTRMKMLIYKQKAESIPKIASPGAKINAIAYFDLALKAADSGRAGDAKLLLDLAMSYSRDASIPDSALSDERRAERGRRMAWIEQNLGEYSGDKGMAAGKRLLLADSSGPGGWKTEGKITAPFASAILKGTSLAEAAGEGKRDEVKAALAKELGREPTEEETDSAVIDSGRKELGNLSVRVAKGSVDQALLEKKVKADGIVGSAKEQETAKAKYSSEAKRLETASKNAKTKLSADNYSELAKLSDFDFVKGSVGKSLGFAEKGSDEIKRSIDLVAEGAEADDAEMPFISKRITELSAGLGPEDKAEIGQFLAAADSMEKSGDKEKADKLRRAIYTALLGAEAKRLMDDGSRLLAFSGGAIDALDVLHTSITKVDTLEREKGRLELGLAGKSCLALASGYDIDEKGEPLQPPKPLTSERAEALIGKAGGSLALGKSLVDQQLAIKKRRDSGIWMENKLFTEDIGKAKGMLKEMAGRPAASGNRLIISCEDRRGEGRPGQAAGDILGARESPRRQDR